MSGVFPDLDAIKKRLDGRQALTRFAPSPTGYLHLGHVVNAIYVWGIAGALEGKVVLRIENHDRQRCRPKYEQAILDDLAWLGFRADLGTPEEFAKQNCEYRQSNCQARYFKDLLQLRDQQHVYFCDCSRKDIQSRLDGPAGRELRYDGFCRHRELEFLPDLGFRLQLSDDKVSFHDLLTGPQTQYPAQQGGDLLLRDRNAQWTYQFGVVADDIHQKINLVIRGMDILESTGRQLMIGRMWEPSFDPIYLHHPLLTDANGRKLSKRDFDADIHELNLAGENPQHVLGKAAALVGLIPEARGLAVEELPGLFVNT